MLDVVIPNGMVVSAANKYEPNFLYSEIFEKNAYVRHGLDVADGDCVFDVGANVGLFSASLAAQHDDLRLVLFEPIPATYAMLERNAKRHLRNARVTLVNAGVTSRIGTTSFVVEPSSTVMAGSTSVLRQLDDGSRAARRRVGVVAWDRAMIADGERSGLMPAPLAERLRKALANPVLRPLTVGAIWALFALRDLKARRSRHEVRCRMTTVSAAMRELDIDRVDFLKIDVEGAEWEVLAGIEAQDWPRVRQLSIEVHDLGGRVKKVRALLEAKGYHVLVESAEWELFELQGIRMVFAHR